MIIDSHMHLPYEYSSIEAKKAALLAEMRKNGVDKGIVISDSELESCIGSTEECAELFCGDDMIKVVAGISPLISFDTQLELCRKLLMSRQIIGLKIYTGHEKFFCTDERLMPVYELAAEFDVPVLFHTGWDDNQYAMPAVMRELAQKRQCNRFVYCHCFYPDTDRCFAELGECENVYFDISSTADNEDILPQIKVSFERGISAAPERFIFGSDFGSCSQRAHIEFANSLELTDKQRELLMHGNAEKVYDL
ncbi:MAG: amidohydrolase [Ruminococcus sp.]|uniref:amidohydrolase family protein n=1 Tax=Ruminococcus sp. TaxID=41978 RepID=UPI0026003B88|nr:amidohydrolase family protein [Ruminococcus sp.]MCR5600588.1 amidohydrolase [Ruminococcus sp.]